MRLLFQKTLSSLAIALVLLAPTTLLASEVYKVTVKLNSTKPINLTQNQILCSTLYSKLSSTTVYKLSSLEGVPFSCTLEDSTDDDDGIYSIVTMTIFVTY